jgi:hypothetical protein
MPFTSCRGFLHSIGLFIDRKDMRVRALSNSQGALHRISGEENREARKPFSPPRQFRAYHGREAINLKRTR